jgi:hypothetical protein
MGHLANVSPEDDEDVHCVPSMEIQLLQAVFKDVLGRVRYDSFSVTAPVALRVIDQVLLEPDRRQILELPVRVEFTRALRGFPGLLYRSDMSAEDRAVIAEHHMRLFCRMLTELNEAIEIPEKEELSKHISGVMLSVSFFDEGTRERVMAWAAIQNEKAKEHREFRELIDVREEYEEVFVKTMSEYYLFLGDSSGVLQQLQAEYEINQGLVEQIVDQYRALLTCLESQ